MGLFNNDGSYASIFFCVRHTEIKTPDIDVIENWGLTEGRRKRGQRRLITGAFFTFFLSFPFQRQRKRERHIYRKSVNHLT